MYKDNFPQSTISLTENEILNYLKVQNQAEGNGFYQMLQKVNTQAKLNNIDLAKLRERIEDADDQLRNPYQIVFDQINVPSLIDLIQDLINTTKVICYHTINNTDRKRHP
jgi:hypothetical protein